MPTDDDARGAALERFPRRLSRGKALSLCVPTLISSPAVSVGTETTLAAHIARRIDVEGPLTIAQYMAEALGHPRYGYYTAGGDPLGVGGDFVTAPEISQMFGELIGLWLLGCWTALGGPPTVTVVELGPGRGSLMVDLLRAARMAPAFRGALRVHLVEISDSLRARQADALAEPIAAGVPVTWHDGLAGLPPPEQRNGPLFLVANEYVDALPIRQFQHAGRHWRERLVDRAPSPSTDADRPAGPSFRFILGPPDAPPSLMIPAVLRTAADIPPDACAEVRPGAPALAAEIGGWLCQAGGIALFIDYGSANSRFGGSFQAIHRHGRVDPLAAPGRADLTAHVDFAMLCRAFAEAGARPLPLRTQRHFLSAVGLETRAATLKANADARQAAMIDRCVHRLIHPSEMGTLFKVLAVTGPDDPIPFGFDVHEPPPTF